MALTETEKANIRSFLGFSSEARQWNPRLESRMDQLGEPSRAAELALVRELLEQIEEISEEFTAAGKTFKTAGIKKVDEVEFFGAGESGTSKFETAVRTGRMLCGRLSTRLGIQLVGDWFSTDGYRGDGWASPSFQSGNGVLPIG